MLLFQCQILMMTIVTYDEAEDKLHTFLTSAIDKDRCSPSCTGSPTSCKAPPLSGCRKKPIGGLTITVRAPNFIFPSEFMVHYADDYSKSFSEVILVPPQ